MDYIYVYDDNNNKIKMEVVAIGILTGLGVGFLARNVNHDDMIKEQEEKKRRR